MTHQITLTQDENESIVEFLQRIDDMQDELVKYMGSTYTHAITSISKGISVIEFNVTRA